MQQTHQATLAVWRHAQVAQLEVFSTLLQAQTVLVQWGPSTSLLFVDAKPVVLL
jgi:hypothetical protein